MKDRIENMIKTIPHMNKISLTTLIHSLSITLTNLYPITKQKNVIAIKSSTVLLNQAGDSIPLKRHAYDKPLLFLSQSWVRFKEICQLKYTKAAMRRQHRREWRKKLRILRSRCFFEEMIKVQCFSFFLQLILKEFQLLEAVLLLADSKAMLRFHYLQLDLQAIRKKYDRYRWNSKTLIMHIFT